MNSFIRAQVLNMLTITKAFEDACRLGAYRDDGYLSPEEFVELEKIQTAVATFRRELSSIQ